MRRPVSAPLLLLLLLALSAALWAAASAAAWTELSAAQGAFGVGAYGGDGASAYDNSLDALWRVCPAGARSVRLTLRALDTEARYDFVRVYDGVAPRARVLAEVSGTLGDASHSGEPVQLDGDSSHHGIRWRTTGPCALVYFHSDSALTRSGFLVSYAADADAAMPALLVQNHEAGTYTLDANGALESTALAFASYYNSEPATLPAPPAPGRVAHVRVAPLSDSTGLSRAAPAVPLTVSVFNFNGTQLASATGGTPAEEVTVDVPIASVGAQYFVTVTGTALGQVSARVDMPTQPILYVQTARAAQFHWPLQGQAAYAPGDDVWLLMLPQPAPLVMYLSPDQISLGPSPDDKLVVVEPPSDGDVFSPRAAAVPLVTGAQVSGPARRVLVHFQSRGNAPGVGFTLSYHSLGTFEPLPPNYGGNTNPFQFRSSYTSFLAVGLVVFVVATGVMFGVRHRQRRLAAMRRAAAAAAGQTTSDDGTPLQSVAVHTAQAVSAAPQPGAPHPYASFMRQAGDADTVAVPYGQAPPPGMGMPPISSGYYAAAPSGAPFAVPRHIFPSVPSASSQQAPLDGVAPASSMPPPPLLPAGDAAATADAMPPPPTPASPSTPRAPAGHRRAPSSGYARLIDDEKADGIDDSSL